MAINEIIQSHGLRLKFKKEYDILTSSSILSSEVSDTKSSVTDSSGEMTQGDQAENDDDGASVSGLSKQTLIEQSKIFGKGKRNPTLLNWQIEVNKAAFTLCVGSNELLYDRAKLKLEAEKKARETYVFKKKRGSRSVFVDQLHAPKKARITTEEREKQIASISAKMESVKQHIALKENLISQSSNTKSYQLCDKWHNELRELLNEQRKLEITMKDLQEKRKKHEEYKKSSEDRMKAKSKNRDTEGSSCASR